MQTKVVTSAIIVSPPDETWGPIQDIRLKFDKAYKRWMPHINLIYPFFPESQFASALPQLRARLASVQPFTVRFETFDFFVHGASSCTLFLHPTIQPPNALRDLQKAIQGVFPMCNEQSTKSAEGFHAHLTVGQFRGKAMTERKKAEFERSWKPIEWRVDHVQMISRTSTGPFQVIHKVPLGASSGQVAGSKPEAPKLLRLDPRPESQPRSAGNNNHPKPEEMEDIVLERLSKWIAQNGGRGNLPKTKAKLRTAIKPMCSLKVQHVDVDEAIKQLQEEGYFRADGSGKVTFLKKKSTGDDSDRFGTNTFVARDSYRLANEAHREPAKIAMTRCREWVEAPLNIPGTLAALKNSLRQLCVLREDLDPEKVVQMLEKAGLIAIDYEDKITYAGV